MAKYCATIECVETAVNEYTIEIEADNKEEAIKKVESAMNDGIGEVFAEFVVVDESIIDTSETTEETLTGVYECKDKK